MRLQRARSSATLPRAERQRCGLGRRLKAARAAAGLSLRALETRIGRRVTAQALGKYERDESPPGSGVLLALAAALDVPLDQLAGDPELVLDSVDSRKKFANRREEARVEGRVVHLAERCLTVEALLELPTVEWDRPRDAPCPAVADVAEAEYAAHGLRADWKLGLDPVPNVIDLLEGQGIKVLVVALTATDGFTARVRRGGRNAVSVIVVNRELCGERQRFTLAHELGRLAMRVGPGADAKKAAQRSPARS